MNIESASKEIIKLRRRLTEIEEERAILAEDAFSERADLLDEEHELHARLAELQDSFSHTEQKITRS